MVYFALIRFNILDECKSMVMFNSVGKYLYLYLRSCIFFYRIYLFKIRFIFNKKTAENEIESFFSI